MSAFLCSCFTRDVAGRITERTTDDGSGSGTPGPQTYTYGPQNRIETSTADVGTNTYTYDSAGRLTQMRNPHGLEIGYEYDMLGRTTAVKVRENAAGTATDADWERTEYGYDANGNLETLTEPDGDEVTMTYDAIDRLSTRTLPNGVVSTWTYDLGGRIESVTHTGSSGVLASRTYTRLPSGEPTRIEREDGSARVLTLDPASRIETENVDDGAGGVNTARRYAYDDDGNRALRVLDEGTASEVSETSTTAAGSELSAIARTGASTSPDAFTYDDAGRMTQLVRGGVTYDLTYGADDELLRVDRDGTLAWDATFDAEGRRVITRAHGPGGTTERRFLVAPSMATSYNSPHLVTDETGAVLTSYIFAGEHALIRLSATGDETYYLRDAVGSVIATVDSAGAVVDRFEYDAFGNAVSGMALPSAAGGDFRFQGMWLDVGVLSELDAYFVRARVYDAATGRFTTRDPAAGRMQTPESYWAYVFGNGNPEWWVDPSGGYSATTSEVSAGVTVQFILATIAVTAATTVGQLIQNSKIKGCIQTTYVPGSGTFGEEALRSYPLPYYQRYVEYYCRRNPDYDPFTFFQITTVRAADPKRWPGFPVRPPLTYNSVIGAKLGLVSLGLVVLP